MTVTLEEARDQLEDLLEKAQTGESVIVVRDGQPIGQILGAPKTIRPPRKAGSAKGQIWIAPDFDESLEDFKDYM